MKTPNLLEPAGTPGSAALAEGNERIFDPIPGYIDFFGYCSAAGGWIFTGWIQRPQRTQQSDHPDCDIHFEFSRSTGKATIAFHQRGDLDHTGIGVIVFVPGSSRIAGNLERISFAWCGVIYSAQSGPTTRRLRDQEIVERARSTLSSDAFSSDARRQLLSVIARPGFTGQDTLAALSELVMLEIDEAIVCPPAGVVLKGWMLVSEGTVKQMRVRSGPRAEALDLARAIRVHRPDVITALGDSTGFSDARCGFTAYVGNAISPGDPCYVEVELESGELGFKCFKLSKRSGMDAIRRVLEGVEPRYGDVDVAFDHVLGPAVQTLNAARLKVPPEQNRVQFGDAPAAPSCSVIIPLYGRVDFVEYQMAFFSGHDRSQQVEFIYVLDDPAKRRELEVLAASTFERFRVPFQVVFLRSNVGFGPASNIGLQHARGEFICFLNSDIFPIQGDWIESLTQKLQSNPRIGVLGARLFFEDGSIQHEGCYYRALEEFAGWEFVEHVNKGRRPVPSAELRQFDVVTGACMFMRRDLAVDLGGFDEAFVTGDFEDADLCQRVRERGLVCAVANDVHMYHLERKSQTAPNQLWRMNLTLYNAWVHQRRWFGAAPADADPMTTGSE